MRPLAQTGSSRSIKSSSREERGFIRKALYLLHDLTGSLGWKYKAWIPVSILFASASLLPPKFLHFFTGNLENLSGNNVNTFLIQLAVFGVLIAVLLWIGNFGERFLIEWLRLRVGIKLRGDAQASILESKLDKIDKAQRGDWMTRVSADLESCEFFLSESLPDQIRDLTIILGTAVLLSLESGWVAAIPIAASLLLAWLNIYVQSTIAPVLDESREMEGDILQTILDSFEGLRTIRSFGGEKTVRSHLKKQLNLLREFSMKIARKVGNLDGMNEMSGQIVITLILTFAAYFVAGKNLTTSAALLYVFYIGLFLDSTKNLVFSAYDWNRFFAEGGRLASILYDPEGKLPPEEPSSKRSGTDAVLIGGRNIEIGYDDESPLISALDFEIRRGELSIIMGPSGSGKSTFLEVLSGLRPHNGGSLYVVNRKEETENLAAIPLRFCAFVEQTPYLFEGSVRDNIRLGRSGAVDFEINTLLQSVGLKETIEERGGLDAKIVDRGRNFSLGQRYRIAFCRALLSHRPFLMIDEPFASLDDDSTGEVIRSIETARNSGAGIVLVTHSVPQELQADQVITIGSEQHSANQPTI